MSKSNSLSKIQQNAGVPMVAEFIGAAMLTLAVLSAVGGFLARTDGAIVAGLALALIVMMFGRVSGANVNPAVTVGLWSIQKLKIETAVAYIIAQVAGAYAALGIWNYMVDQAVVLPPRVRSENIDFFIAELIGSFIFGYGIATTIYYKDKIGNTAFLVGGSLFLGASIAVMAGYGLLNPAIAAAVDQINWMHILGPIVGMVVGMNACKFIYSTSGD